MFVCCGLCKKEGRNTTFLNIAIGLFALLIAAIVIMIIFLGITTNKIDDSVCSIFRLPSGVIDGFRHEEGGGFLGI